MSIGSFLRQVFPDHSVIDLARPASAADARDEAMRTLRAIALGLDRERSRGLALRAPLERRALRVGALAWPLNAGVRALLKTRQMKRGRAGQSLQTLGTLALWMDCWRVACRSNVAPSAYYRFRMFRPENRARAERYLQDHESAYLTRMTWEGLDTDLAASINDKLRFHALMQSLDLPVAPVLAASDDGGAVRWLAPDRMASVPEEDVILKITSEASGVGVELLRWDPDRRQHRRGQEWLDAQGVLAHMRSKSVGTTSLLQPRLVNHEALMPISGKALSTARILTAVDPHGQPQVAAAGLRMGVGASVVDNLNQGGLAAPIELTTGRLGAAGTKDVTAGWFQTHPDTGHRIEGMVLPHWQRAMQVALAAHAAVPGIPTIGWDVPITQDGPVLLEGNLGWDSDLVQLLGDTALGETLVADTLLRALR